MTTLLTPPRAIATLADLVRELGDIPLERIRFHPPPGTATETDVLAIHGREKRLYELVNGVLVEKGMGFRESCLAAALLCSVKNFVQPRNLGLVAGASAMFRLAVGLVRIPDGSFVAWDRIPGRRMPQEPIPHFAPSLAVEVLSQSNTTAEMARKCREFFDAGVLLVWIVDPVARTVEVYTSVDSSRLLNVDDTLDGGDVLPGFNLPVRELFAELDQEGEPPPPKSGRARRKGRGTSDDRG